VGSEGVALNWRLSHASVVSQQSMDVFAASPQKLSYKAEEGSGGGLYTAIVTSYWILIGR